MAKITSVELLKVPKHINVGDEISDITVLTSIRFHPMDLKLQMEYCLHVFVYDIHGDMDAPLIIPNWDESDVLPICMGRKDDFLGKVVTFFDAKKKEVVIENPMALKLGKFNRELSYT
ncbi:MAG: hypothetical protein HKP38_08050, partial [Croceitalea sp.]|nr:hypothetical protein [Croceitalea sp.]